MPHEVTQRSNSRRRPYPYDMYIGNTKVMLQPDADGNIVAQRSKTLDATAPVDYSYSSANPYKERTFEWTKLYGGFGQAIEDNDRKPHRYEHGEFVDTSVNGTVFKGPNFEDNVQTIHASADDVRQFVYGPYTAGTYTVYAVCKDGVFARTSDAATGGWAAVLTIGLGGTALTAGQHPQHALWFKHRGASVDSLYVCCETGYLWRFDGTTWTQAAAGEGPGTGVSNGEARFVEQVNEELWVAGDSWVVRTTDSADPMLRASWGGVIFIGDKTSKISWLKKIGNSLFIFKDDGSVHTIDDTGEAHEIYARSRGLANRRNGRNAATWLDRLWAPLADQAFTITEDGTFSPDGLEQVLENQSVIRGRWAAGAGHHTWFMYEIYYNPTTADSYLIKHGTWIEATETGQIVPGLAQFADAHHGALYIWESQEVTACEILAGEIFSGVNDRFYVGFSDGTIAWCILPQGTPNPVIDPACEFTANPSYLYLPIHHMGYQSDNKLYRGISVVGPLISNTETVLIEYRFDTVNTFADWITLDTADPLFTLPNERKEFPNDTYAKHIQIVLTLTSSNPSLTPVIDGIAVHQALRPSLALEWVFSARLASFLPKHNGTVDRRRGSELRRQVQEACASYGNTLITLPTGEEELMTLIDYRESGANWSKRRDHEWLAQITGIQLRTLSSETPGFSGLTYMTLEQYTVGELESIL